MCTYYIIFEYTYLIKINIKRKEVEEFFNYMDRDYDGRLSFEEFMGEECTIEKLFKNMDKNNDGYISKHVSTRSKEKLQNQINYSVRQSVSLRLSISPASLTT